MSLEALAMAGADYTKVDAQSLYSEDSLISKASGADNYNKLLHSMSSENPRKHKFSKPKKTSRDVKEKGGIMDYVDDPVNMKKCLREWAKTVAKLAVEEKLSS